MSMVQSRPMQSTPVVAMRSSKPPNVGVEGQGHARVGGAHLVHHLLNVGLAPLLHMCGGSWPPGRSKIWTHCAPASIWYVVAHDIRHLAEDARGTSGFCIAIDLIVLYVDEEPPSTMYVARVGRANETEHGGGVADLVAEDAEGLAHEGEHVEVELLIT